jgi:hypothetical protein
VIRERQTEYYQALAVSDKQGNSTAFIDFLLSALLQALHKAHPSDHVTDQVSDQVKALLRIMPGPARTLPLTSPHGSTRSHQPRPAA